MIQHDEFVRLNGEIGEIYPESEWMLRYGFFCTGFTAGYDAALKDLRVPAYNIPNRVHFYYMHDNHCFTRLYGTTLTEITDKCTAVRNESPWGMLCPPLLLHDDKEIRRIRHHVHCTGRDKDEKWNTDLQKWRDELAQDPDLIRLIGK